MWVCRCSTPCRALGRPDAYPHDPSARQGVEQRQTHISLVFLTADYVYKLRKPVRLDFVDFSDRGARDHDCERELALNRRLAPSVYLGIAPILHSPEGVEVAQTREHLSRESRTLEHCVVMRRLPPGRDARALLASGRLESRHVEAVARRLAGFHQRHGCGRPAPFSGAQWLERITRPAEENFATLARLRAVVDAALTRRAQERTQAAIARCREAFERRRLAGRAVDGHGDLHLEHIWFERDDDPLMIDCIEFSDDLRVGDAASDLAFLAMDLRYHSANALAEHLLATYAEETDDYDLYAVVDYFISYRAAVRAKVAALTAGQPEVPAQQRRAARESARKHLELCTGALTPRDLRTVVLTCGPVAAGKTSVAWALARAIGAVVIASDRLRHHVAPGHGARRQDRYSFEARLAVYRAMFERALSVVQSGRPAILDATFSLESFRNEVRRWAAAHGLLPVLVEVRADRQRARDRAAARAARGKGAGVEVVEQSWREFEPPAEWPASRRVQVDTSDPAWARQINALAARLALVQPPSHSSI
ncbi:MAG: hypothetical protein D6760_08165 [Deltaproteobacteria bacterium]|nr:MAG: hypothetical protein D6760_08165 [Deltaproteobacteria bacterium]